MFIISIFGPNFPQTARFSAYYLSTQKLSPRCYRGTDPSAAGVLRCRCLLEQGNGEERLPFEELEMNRFKQTHVTDWRWNVSLGMRSNSSQWQCGGEGGVGGLEDLSNTLSLHVPGWSQDAYLGATPPLWPSWQRPHSGSVHKLQLLESPSGVTETPGQRDPQAKSHLYLLN